MAPRCTRRVAVCSFQEPVPLFVVTGRGQDEEISAEIMFTAVSVGSSSKLQQSSEATRRFVRVAFWVDDRSVPVYETTTHYPENWTPYIFLSALKLTIKRNHLVHCDYRSPHAAVLNEVHFLFSGTLENALEVLESKNAFLLVMGGEEN